MTKRVSPTQRSGAPRWVAAAVLTVAVSVAPVVHSDEMADRRMEAGTRLFRALLAADVDLPKKAAGNQLLILFYYAGDGRRAADLAKAFMTAGDVRGLTVSAEVTNDATFAKYGARIPAAIFISEPSPRAAVQSIVHYGIDHRVIVYSPFEGDVENGVLGGLSIEAQVRPFLNRATLESSHITLKAFFLQVAKVYP
jgi:hypothetical protein